MGTVLLLRPDGFNTEHLKSGEVHINVWLLPAVVGTRYMMDLGFSVNNGHSEASLDHVVVVVPFEKPETKCLVSLMQGRAAQSWRVIFGSRAPVEDARIRCGLETITNQVPKGYSMWKVKLDPPLMPGTEGYVRIRFASYEKPEFVDFFGGLLGLGERLRIDLRLFDHREHSEFLDSPIRFETKRIPIMKSNVYVVAPQAKRPEMYSPAFEYIRVLESNLWNAYLERRPSWWKPMQEKMHIFAWKRSANGTGEALECHRVFVTFVPRGAARLVLRVMGLGAWLVLIFAGGVTLTGALRIGTGTTEDGGVVLPGWAETIRRLWLLAVIFVAPPILQKAVQWMKWTRTAFEKFDGWLYGHHH